MQIVIKLTETENPGKEIKCSGEENEFYFGHGRLEVPVHHLYLAVWWTVGNVQLEQSRQGNRWCHQRTTGLEEKGRAERKPWKDGSQWSILRKSSPNNAASWHVSARMRQISKNHFLTTHLKVAAFNSGNELSIIVLTQPFWGSSRDKALIHRKAAFSFSLLWRMKDDLK